MAKTPRNQGKSWTKGDESQLRELAKGNTPTRVAALKLERSEDAVRNKASELRRQPEADQPVALQSAEEVAAQGCGLSRVSSSS